MVVQKRLFLNLSEIPKNFCKLKLWTGPIEGKILILSPVGKDFPQLGKIQSTVPRSPVV